MTEPFTDHAECEIITETRSYDTYRVLVEEGYARIAKNVHNEVDEQSWHCLDHQVAIEAPEDYEWDL